MKLDAVIVTFNRLKDLKECLKKYDEQKGEIDSLIVINNCSTDGTKEYLEEWKKIKAKFEKKVVHLSENTGGSGGFYEGMKYAMLDKADWVWLHDDDAFIDELAILNLKKAIEKYKGENISAICGMVYDKNEIAFDHRRIIKKGLLKNKDVSVEANLYDKEVFELNEFSYVGVAINIEKLYEVGITNKSFFIFLDDTEHSYRLSQRGKILCIPNIKIRHDNKYQESNHIANWKLYYSIRNNIYFSKYCIKGGLIYWLIYFYLTALFKKIVRRDNVGSKLVIDAINDGLKGNMGKNNVYKPGWKVNG